MTKENKDLKSIYTYVVIVDRITTGGKREVEGVFTTEELAKQFALKLKNENSEHKYTYMIDCFILKGDIKDNGYEYGNKKVE